MSFSQESGTQKSAGIGTQLAATGAYVLKLSLAGSGDRGWRKYNSKENLRYTGDTFSHLETIKKRKKNKDISHIKDMYGDKINCENENSETDNLVWLKKV